MYEQDAMEWYYMRGVYQEERKKRTIDAGIVKPSGQPDKKIHESYKIYRRTERGNDKKGKVTVL